MEERAGSLAFRLVNTALLKSLICNAVCWEILVVSERPVTNSADVIIDLATVTGAQSYVSGKLQAALLTDWREWERKACVDGRRSGDFVAPMVFCPDLHFQDLKSPVTDMRYSNLGKTEVNK
ncbi:putative aminopeptidase npepl1, partial [Parelaphostrongylus tenuis]